jgi:hypothetical protein
MIVEVRLCFDIQYFRCPAKVGRNVRKLQKDFDRWLYDRESNHPYWEIAHEDEEGNKFYGVCFDAEAFVYWLNNVRFKKGKRVAKLIETPNKSPKKKIGF